MNQQEREISKAEFKTVYFRHAKPGSGWTQEYWDTFFEEQTGQQYFIFPSENAENTQMFIRKEGNKHCIFFLSEESEESFFAFPDRDE